MVEAIQAEVDRLRAEDLLAALKCKGADEDGGPEVQACQGGKCAAPSLAELGVAKQGDGWLAQQARDTRLRDMRGI